MPSFRILTIVFGIAVFSRTASSYAAIQNCIPTTSTFSAQPGWLPKYFVVDFCVSFSDPNDEVLSVVGTPGYPLMIDTVDPSGFFNAAANSNGPPSASALAANPALNWDSFVTIGVASYSGTNPVITGINVTGTNIATTSGGWVPNPAAPAIGRAGNYPGNRVLLARLTVRQTACINFRAVVNYRSGGQNLSSNIFIPMPLDCPLRDCNANGTFDLIDIDNGIMSDCNNDGLGDQCQNVCLANVNGDCAVNIDDLVAVITSWNSCHAPCCTSGICSVGGPPYCRADITNNCLIDIDDLVAVITAWGPCP